MKGSWVRYKVKPDQADRNEELVRPCTTSCDTANPPGFATRPSKMQDGVTFVHLAEFENGQNPLTQLKSFKDFQEGIRARCDERPVITELRELGSFRLFGG